MMKIVEELQARVTETKRRLDEATQIFQAAQQAFQIAQQDHNIWNLALQAEVREENRRLAAATEKQLPLPSAHQPTIIASDASDSSASDSSDSGSKTGAVRDLLKQHPAGMTAPEIWREVSGQFKHRPYLYSVLKRLRDRREVMKRRTKYYLEITTKMDEGKEQSVVQ